MRQIGTGPDSLRMEVSSVETPHLAAAPTLQGVVLDAIAALEELVRLKRGPRDEEYETRKDAAWETARQALADLDFGAGA